MQKVREPEGRKLNKKKQPMEIQRAIKPGQWCEATVMATARGRSMSNAMINTDAMAVTVINQ